MWAIAGGDYAPDTSLGLSITFGSILGLTMGANVWMIIWPNQQINIKSAESVAAGGEADPAAAGAAKRPAGRAGSTPSSRSRWRSSWSSRATSRRGSPTPAVPASLVWILFIIILAGAELSALGKLPGGYDSPFCKLVLDDHIKTIEAGLLTTAILYFIGWELIIG